MTVWLENSSSLKGLSISAEAPEAAARSKIPEIADRMGK
jgi:hypothetical protein